MDLEEDHGFAASGGKLVDDEVHTRRQPPRQPVLQLLVADLFPARLELRADDGVGVILDAPDKVTAGPAVQGGRVR